MQGKVFIWVQHLLGIGHAMRAAHLARHLAAQGWEVSLASGGMKLPLDIGRARLYQLAPAGSIDAQFSGLADSDGRAVDEAWKSARSRRLLDLFRAADPDVLLIEHYPFGRRQLRFELEPLLAAACARRPRPLVLCSLRDILVRRTALRDAESAALVEQSFDAVLVHGDETLVSLVESFAAADRIAPKLVYTGYIGAGDFVAPVAVEPRRGIVVSAGGGAVGDHLLVAAIEAAGLLPERRPWHVLIGANADAARFEALCRGAPHVTIERARRDFRALLAGAELSISQAGYNTVVDILAARVRSVLVPFAAGRETEQTQRAQGLARLGLARVLPETALSPPILAGAVANALTEPFPAHRLRLTGELETDRILRRMLAAHRAKAAE